MATHQNLQRLQQRPGAAMTERTKGEVMELGTLVEKYNACVANLDTEKTCPTCKHRDVAELVLPCSRCYSELFGMPVNPTDWEPKP